MKKLLFLLFPLFSTAQTQFDNIVIRGTMSSKNQPYQYSHNLNGLMTDLSVPNKKYVDSLFILSPGSGGTYVLPVSTPTTLGGVKIGAGISMTNGVISSTPSWYAVTNKPDLVYPNTMLSGVSSGTMNISSAGISFNGVASNGYNFSHKVNSDGVKVESPSSDQTVLSVIGGGSFMGKYEWLNHSVYHGGTFWTPIFKNATLNRLTGLIYTPVSGDSMSQLSSSLPMLASDSSFITRVYADNRYARSSTTSDIRLKDVIDYIIPEAPSLLIPITFTYKNDASRHIHYGYSAQQVKRYIPSLVGTEPDRSLGMHYTLDYVELHTIQIEQLIRANKLLEIRINEMEKSLKRKKGK